MQRNQHVEIQDSSNAIGAAAGRELNEALSRIEHCLGQLTAEQVWWRPDESQNSIGNLILHLCGNLRQWLISGVGGAKDNRNRPAEFSERREVPVSELIAMLRNTVSESVTAISNVPAVEMLRRRRIQGFDETALSAIFSAVPHFRGHTQEIIYRTRSFLGDRYRFAWKPSTAEEGAPA